MKQNYLFDKNNDICYDYENCPLAYLFKESTVNIVTLKRTLLDFAQSPNKAWGTPTNEHPKTDRMVYQAYWNRDGWKMSAVDSIGGRKRIFSWYNQNSAGNVSHQGLVVERSADGTVKKLSFSTVAINANRCYKLVFDIKTNTIECLICADRVVSEDSWNKPGSEKISSFHPFIFDFVLAMMPSWMLYTHRPRNILNGCFE